MKKWSRYAFAILLMFMSSQLYGSDDAISCVKEISMPSAYTGILRYIPAVVKVRILIGERGEAKLVTYDTEIEALKGQLSSYFKERTTYASACKGKTITFTVRYTLIGPELGVPASEVRFEPPDRLLVICHRLAPSFDPPATLK